MIRTDLSNLGGLAQPVQFIVEDRPSIDRDGNQRGIGSLLCRVEIDVWIRNGPRFSVHLMVPCENPFDFFGEHGRTKAVDGRGDSSFLLQDARHVHVTNSIERKMGCCHRDDDHDDGHAQNHALGYPDPRPPIRRSSFSVRVLSSTPAWLYMRVLRGT